MGALLPCFTVLKKYKSYNLLKKHTNLQKCTKNAQIRQVVYFENSS